MMVKRLFIYFGSYKPCIKGVELTNDLIFMYQINQFINIMKTVNLYYSLNNMYYIAIEN